MAKYVNPLSRAVDELIDNRAHIQHPRHIPMCCQYREVVQPLLCLQVSEVCVYSHTQHMEIGQQKFQ